MKKLEQNSTPVFITPEERAQNILQKQIDLDELDFQIAKKERQRKLRKIDGVGAKIKDALEDVGTALDGFGDMGLKQDDNIKSNSKPTKFIDDLATFK